MIDYVHKMKSIQPNDGMSDLQIVHDLDYPA